VVALERVKDPVGQRDRLSFTSLSEDDGDASFEVDDGMREALLTSGCALCGAPVVAADLSAGSTAAE
jgi:hypothetical protein